MARHVVVLTDAQASALESLAACSSNTWEDALAVLVQPGAVQAGYRALDALRHARVVPEDRVVVALTRGQRDALVSLCAYASAGGPEDVGLADDGAGHQVLAAAMRAWTELVEAR